MTAFAVIGAQYGDEGKGLMVDFLAANLGGPRAVVVRSNGGSQAGHTVVTPEGQRHVFSHFGSGSFTGARTHLSRFMIVNPVFFVQERMRLLSAGCRAPKVSVDPHAMVTLPFDALINQIVESHRGNARHGSCGHGIGETVERNENEEGFPLTVGDLRGKSLDDFKAIRDAWVPKRLAMFGITAVPDDYAALLTNDDLLVEFINACNSFEFFTEVVRDEDIKSLGSVIFEAAQGLALDAEMGSFPYVTRSNTGLKNIIELCRIAGITEVQAHYMSRIYTTRHGAGPLPRESDISADIEVNDPTNVPNDWQGTLRFAPLDVNNLINNIRKDIHSVDIDLGVRRSGKVVVHPTLVLTCLDQITERVPVFHDDVEITLRPEDVRSAFQKWCGWGTRIVEAWGPSREDVFGHILVDQNGMSAIGG